MMNKNKTIKEMFNKKINKNAIYDKVEEKVNNNFLYRRVLYLVPVMLIVIFVIILSPKNNSLNSDTNNRALNINEGTITNSLDEININEVTEESGSLKLDANIKIVNNIYIPYFEVLNNLDMPKDFDGNNMYAVYLKDENKEYNILNNYVFHYFNTKNNRNVLIAISDTFEPVRDYYFNESTFISSVINNVELTIYKYRDNYMTAFIYKGYYFDIESNSITEEEFINLINSIIKQ